MKVLLVGNYPPDDQESMSRYASWLSSALIAAGVDVKILKPAPCFGHNKFRAWPLGKWLAYIDKFVLFPWKLIRRAQWADVVHILDHGNSMYVFYLARTPNIVTCHDLLAVRGALGMIDGLKVGKTGRLFQFLIRQGLVHAAHVICVSQATLSDLRSVSPRLRSTPEIIENPLNWPYIPMSPALAWARIRRDVPGLSTKFFLHVGGNQWYKNRIGVIRIFDSLRRLSPEFEDYQLIMAGKPFDSLIEQALNAENEGHIVSLEKPPNDLLQALYSVTEGFLFPSLAEGFGWPIIEAQACGALVITSNRPPMDQIAGDGAILISPDRPEEAAQSIAQAWEKREELRSRSVVNAGRFSEKKAIKRYIESYKNAIAVGSHER